MNNHIPEDAPSEGCGHPSDSPSPIGELIPAPSPKKEATHCCPDQTPAYKTAMELAAILVALLVAWIYWGQLDAMQGQLKQMEGSSAQTDQMLSLVRQQLDKLKEQAADTHTLAEQAKVQAGASKTIAEQTSVQAAATNKLAGLTKKAMDQNVELANEDRRAWVGFGGSETVGGEISGEHKEMFSYKGVKIAIENSGKTPAINLSVATMHVALPRAEPIRDYDSFNSRWNKERDEDLARLDADLLRRNPDRAEDIKAMIQQRNATQSQFEAEVSHLLFPAGGVIAPGTQMTQTTGGAANRVYDDKPPGGHLTVYILGKITYNDIFAGTKQHTTKFCLMRVEGTEFTICPSGNWMD